jgi:hypothetical protein
MSKVGNVYAKVQTLHAYPVKMPDCSRDKLGQLIKDKYNRRLDGLVDTFSEDIHSQAESVSQGNSKALD